MSKQPLKAVDFRNTAYLNIVDLRNPFLLIRSIDHPNTSIDGYKGTLGKLAEALRQIVVAGFGKIRYLLRHEPQNE